jgi:Ca2+-binding EF-hand superfamily protein
MLRVEALEYDVEMGVLSSQWGIKVEEVHALRESFEFCDVDGSGKIDEDELVPLLENVGCPPTTQMQKSIITECLKRCDLGGDLNLAGTLRLVTTYQKALARATVRSFNPSEDGEGPKTPGGSLIPDLTSLIDENDAGKPAKKTEEEETDGNGDPNPVEPRSPKPEGSIPMKKLVLAFYEVGQCVSRPEVADLLEQVGVDAEEDTISATNFEQILRIHRTNKLLEWRRSYGFTPSQLDKFRKCCKRNGCDELNIKLEEVLSLADDLGLAPVDTEHREALMRALMRVDRKGSGMISFEEFVLLLRHLDNQKLRRRNQEEFKAAKAAGLDAESVQQFREAFNSLADSSKTSCTKKAIREYLKQNGVVVAVDKKKQLEQIFKQIEEKIVGQATMELTFAQFLWVLRGLDNNGEI